MGNTYLDYYWVSIWHNVCFLGIWRNYKQYQNWYNTDVKRVFDPVVTLCLN